MSFSSLERQSGCSPGSSKAIPERATKQRAGTPRLCEFLPVQQPHPLTVFSVVCPLALGRKWAEEIAKMAKGLRVIKHLGPSQTKSAFPCRLFYSVLMLITGLVVLRHAHVVITTYDTVRFEHTAFKPTTKDEIKSTQAIVALFYTKSRWLKSETFLDRTLTWSSSLIKRCGFRVTDVPRGPATLQEFSFIALEYMVAMRQCPRACG